MKELAMNKAFAELEGISVAVSRSMLNEIKLVIGPDGLQEFNPITDLALTMKAVLDYEVFIDHRNDRVFILNMLSEETSVDFEHRTEIPKAIIECILKSKGLWKA